MVEWTMSLSPFRVDAFSQFLERLASVVGSFYYCSCWGCVYQILGSGFSREIHLAGVEIKGQANTYCIFYEMSEKQLNSPYGVNLIPTRQWSCYTHASENTREDCWIWWLTPVILALGRLRQEYQEFIVIVCHIVSSTAAWAIRDYCLKN